MGNHHARQVLIVDDESPIRALVVRFLEQTGLETRSFANADDARRAVSEHLINPDLVITDVSMPGTIDGIAFAAWLHARTPSLPIVLMSGDAVARDKARSVPAVRAVLAKPFTLDELLLVTRRVLVGAEPSPSSAM